MLGAPEILLWEDQRHWLTARVTDCRIDGLTNRPRACPKVRLRCVGAEGAGHSAWSQPVIVSTPGAPPLSETTSSGLSDSTVGPVVATTKRDRARRRNAATSADDDSDVRPRGGMLSSEFPPDESS